MKKVAVVMGGVSSEREISLKSGTGVVQALKRCGYSVQEIDLTDDIAAFIKTLKAFQPDVVFNALHGKFGEDGCVPGLLNMLKIPYTHSGVLASSIGMDKEQTRKIAKVLGVPVAAGGLKTLEQMQKKQMPYPYVAKPNAEGSSVGVHIVRNDEDQKRLFRAWPKADSFLVEKYIPGKELTAAVMNGLYLGDLEIVPQTGFYDYKNKYTKGKSAHITPAPVSTKIKKQMQKYTLTIYHALGCRGVCRCDFRLDDTNPAAPKLVFLEINTHPGMTELSLVPDIAKQQKISYDTIVEKLVMEARCD